MRLIVCACSIKISSNIDYAIIDKCNGFSFTLNGLVSAIKENVVDVAHRKPTKSSSQMSAASPSVVVDGVVPDFLNDESCHRTREERSPWWSVNFLQPSVVHAVRFTVGPDCCGEEPVSLEIRVGNERAMKKNSLCARYHGKIAAGTALEVRCYRPLRGMYLSLTQSSQRPLSLSLCHLSALSDSGLPPEQCPFIAGERPWDIHTFDGSCYHFVTAQAETFQGAMQFCARLGGQLISGTSPAFQGFVSWVFANRRDLLLTPTQDYWMGSIRSPATDWQWAWLRDGKAEERVSRLRSFWAGRTPPRDARGINDCAAFEADSGWLWVAQDCSRELNFVCRSGPMHCGSPSMHGNTTVDYESAEVGMRAVYQCQREDSGLKGDAVRECKEDGEWTGQPPLCADTNVDCGVPPSLREGQVYYTGSKPGNSAAFQCDAGTFLEGQETIVCGTDGRWSGPAPVCIAIDCGEPPIIADATAALPSRSTGYDSVVKYYCDDGFRMQDVADRLRCVGSGRWDGKRPRCIPIHRASFEAFSVDTSSTTAATRPADELTTTHSSTPDSPQFGLGTQDFGGQGFGSQSEVDSTTPDFRNRTPGFGTGLQGLRPSTSATTDNTMATQQFGTGTLDLLDPNGKQRQTSAVSQPTFTSELPSYFKTESSTSSSTSPAISTTSTLLPWSSTEDWNAAYEQSTAYQEPAARTPTTTTSSTTTTDDGFNAFGSGPRGPPSRAEDVAPAVVDSTWPYTTSADENDRFFQPPTHVETHFVPLDADTSPATRRPETPPRFEVSADVIETRHQHDQHFGQQQPVDDRYPPAISTSTSTSTEDFKARSGLPIGILPGLSDFDIEMPGFIEGDEETSTQSSGPEQLEFVPFGDRDGNKGASGRRPAKYEVDEEIDIVVNVTPKAVQARSMTGYIALAVVAGIILVICSGICVALLLKRRRRESDRARLSHYDTESEGRPGRYSAAWENVRSGVGSAAPSTRMSSHQGQQIDQYPSVRSMGLPPTRKNSDSGASDSSREARTVGTIEAPQNLDEIQVHDVKDPYHRYPPSIGQASTFKSEKSSLSKGKL